MSTEKFALEALRHSFTRLGMSYDTDIGLYDGRIYYVFDNNMVVAWNEELNVWVCTHCDGTKHAVITARTVLSEENQQLIIDGFFEAYNGEWGTPWLKELEGERNFPWVVFVDYDDNKYTGTFDAAKLQWCIRDPMGGKSYYDLPPEYYPLVKIFSVGGESVDNSDDMISDEREHNHYFKDVRHLDYIDVYRVIELFNVTDPCLQHLLKKALCVGIRGHKDEQKDFQDIYDSAKRALEMRKENNEKL